MGRNEYGKIVWDEGGTCRAVKGRILSDEDDYFLVVLLVDGTELRIAKGKVIKIERFPEGQR